MTTDQWILLTVACVALFFAVVLFIEGQFAWVIPGGICGVCVWLILTSPSSDQTAARDNAYDYSVQEAVSVLTNAHYDVVPGSIAELGINTWSVRIDALEGDPCKATVKVEGSYDQYLILFGGCEA